MMSKHLAMWLSVACTSLALAAFEAGHPPCPLGPTGVSIACLLKQGYDIPHDLLVKEVLALDALLQGTSSSQLASNNMNGVTGGGWKHAPSPTGTRMEANDPYDDVLKASDGRGHVAPPSPSVPNVLDYPQIRSMHHNTRTREAARPATRRAPPRCRSGMLLGCFAVILLWLAVRRKRQTRRFLRFRRSGASQQIQAMELQMAAMEENAEVKLAFSAWALFSRGEEDVRQKMSMQQELDGLRSDKANLQQRLNCLNAADNSCGSTGSLSMMVGNAARCLALEQTSGSTDHQAQQVSKKEFPFCFASVQLRGGCTVRKLPEFWGLYIDRIGSVVPGTGRANFKMKRRGCHTRSRSFVTKARAKCRLLLLLDGLLWAASCFAKPDGFPHLTVPVVLSSNL